MNKRISNTTNFLLQLDGLKSVNLRTDINVGERLENSAEIKQRTMNVSYLYVQRKDIAVISC